MKGGENKVGEHLSRNRAGQLYNVPAPSCSPGTSGFRVVPPGGQVFSPLRLDYY